VLLDQNAVDGKCRWIDMQLVKMQLDQNAIDGKAVGSKCSWYKLQLDQNAAVWRLPIFEHGGG